MINLLLLLQTVTPSPAATPAVHETLERQPALLSLIFMAGLALAVLLLLVALIRYRKQPSAFTAVAAEDLPDEVRRKLGATATNRGLKALRALFVVMALGIFGAHIYWAKFAEATNKQFQDLNYKDQRNRRIDASILNGWILDRSGKLDKAIAYYKKQPNGSIDRAYNYDIEFSHLLGTNFGAPGLERALFQIQSTEAPESLDLVRGNYKIPEGQKDVQLTLDPELQKRAKELLKDPQSGKERIGAVVMLNPQTGDVLALYSNPSYSLKAAQNQNTWRELDADKKNKPLLNHATRSYYVAGSTFKTVMLIGAYRFGLQDKIFPGSGGGFYAEPGARPIVDDGGSCHACGNVDINLAFQKSSNQYFAQMALELGTGRVRELAQKLGIGAYDAPRGSTQGRLQPEIWNSGNPAVRSALAPNESYMVTGDKMRRYDLALEGFGQGYASQMTPLQMALVVSAAANTEGKLMKPKIEYDRKPEIFSQVLTREQAAEVRRIMGLVAQPGGTGAGGVASATQAGITSGGKTGTAQMQMPVFDPVTGQPKTVRKYERDPKGNIIREYDEIVLEDDLRSDAWYLSFAPLDKPTIAMAVFIQGPGPGVSYYGGRYAAPVAAQMMLKAKQLGYFGGQRDETPTAAPTKPPAAKPKPKPRR